MTYSPEGWRDGGRFKIFVMTLDGRRELLAWAGLVGPGAAGVGGVADDDARLARAISVLVSVRPAGVPALAFVLDVASGEGGGLC